MSMQAVNNSSRIQNSKAIILFKISKYIYLALVVMLPVIALALSILISLSLGLINGIEEVIEEVIDAAQFEAYLIDSLLFTTMLFGFLFFTVIAPMTLMLSLLIIEGVTAIWSIAQVSLLCIFNKRPKLLPVVILFRILTVLFGIATIICTVLLFTQTICVYDFLRTVVFFFGGSIVLNLAVE